MQFANKFSRCFMPLALLLPPEHILFPDEMLVSQVFATMLLSSPSTSLPLKTVWKQETFAFTCVHLCHLDFFSSRKAEF